MTQHIRLLADVTAAPDPARPLLGALLVERGFISTRRLDWALTRQRRSRAPLGAILLAHGDLTEDALADALADQAGAARWRADDLSACPRGIDRVGSPACASGRIVPLTRRGGVTPVATSRPNEFAARQPELERALGRVAMLVCTERDVDRLLTAHRRHALVARAESRVPTPLSCRGMAHAGRNRLVAAVLIVTFISALAIAPVAIVTVLALLAMAIAGMNAALAFSAAICIRPMATSDGGAVPLHLPRITLLVPLFRERDIAGALIGRLSRLDYPRELLDICLLTEAGDTVTRASLQVAALPRWMRSIVVTEGTVMTKPRAMNYALDFSDGEIVGIFDAEDAPSPDVLLRVAAQFSNAPRRTACLQGRLSFYNAQAGWIARCFTIDYATWFGLILPMLHRLGWPVPLGGTTVFFKRDVLERLGAWDAHNVTEDADLGIRLARNSWRTDLLDTTTMEEAVTRPVPWIRQRSRWLKGYAITWAVHMRNPVRLWRDLGPSGFVGFQVLCLGSLLGTMVAPLLWSFWLLMLGLPHFWSGSLSFAAGMTLTIYLAACALGNLTANVVAVRRLDHPGLARWSLVMQMYYPMATLAMAKGLAELIRNPFYWDKTQHGVSFPDLAAAVMPRQGIATALSPAIQTRVAS